MYGKTLLLTSLLLMSYEGRLLANDGIDCSSTEPVCACCQACAATCKIKVCRVSEEKKKVSKTVYSCECEDFCIPGKSTFCGYECDCGSSCSGECKKKWIPGCGEVRTRLILKKSSKEEEVTAYRWEVVEACQSCATRYDGCELSTTQTPKGAETRKVSNLKRLDLSRRAMSLVARVSLVAPRR